MSKVGLRLALLSMTLPARALAQQAGAAPAAAPSEQVSLHYSTEAGCPNEADFVEEVLARVRRPVEWSEVGAGVQMVVTIRRSDDGASGTLEVAQRSTEPTHREFTSNSCAEVSSALALVAALALDPNARTEQLPARPATTTTAPEAPVAAAPLVVAAVPATLPGPTPITSPATAAAPPSLARGKKYLVWLGPTAAVASGYASGLLVLPGLAVGARSTRRGLSPGFQLTPLWGKTGTTGGETLGGSFSWLVGRLEACPIHVTLAPTLGFEPCTAAEIGQLWARGDAVGITPVSTQRWWFAAGATGSLHWSLGSWFARLGGSALFPVTRDEFVFHDPNRSIHQASWLLVGGTLSLGFQFGS